PIGAPRLAREHRRRRTRVIWVGGALGWAAGRRRRTLAHRLEGAIIIIAAFKGPEVHANGITRIIGLSAGVPCCSHDTHRQNRESQSAHWNLLEGRHNTSALDPIRRTSGRNATAYCGADVTSPAHAAIAHVPTAHQDV